jgi:transcriptional regulator with XRE-family HTH domain
MSSLQFPNYLVRHRKSLGLSQADVAFLLGSKRGEKVSRHEAFVREPSLRDALAYEAIYKRTPSEIFDGLYHQIEREVAERAKSLAASTAGRTPGVRNVQRHKVLEGLADMGCREAHNQQ